MSEQTGPRDMVVGDLEKLEKSKMKHQMLQMRMAGIGIQQIAEKFDKPPHVTGRYIKEALGEAKDIVALESAEHLQLELEMLQRLQVGIWTKATQGDLQAIDRILKIQERRASLLGLDSPVTTKTEISGPNGQPLQIARPDLSQLTAEQLEQLENIKRTVTVEPTP